MSNPTTDTAKTLRRALLYLSMASLEFESMELDDRIKPGARAKFRRYRERHTQWVKRDITTDMRDYVAANEVTEELTSERVQDLKLLLDFVIQFENIGEILNELEGAFDTQNAAA